MTSNRRRRRRVSLAAVTLFTLAALALWWLMEPARESADLADNMAPASTRSSVGQDGDADRTVAARRDSREEQANSSAPQRDSEWRPPIVDVAIPTADAIKILLPMAEAGRADAMRELADRLIACRNYIDVDEAAVRRIALREFYYRWGNEPKSDQEVSEIARIINSRTPMLDRCRGVDPALMSTRIDWMERAARGGDVGALLGYGGKALNDMRDVDDILINFDEVARRRQLAGSFLHAALNRGACSALVMLSSAYSGRRDPYDWLYKADPYLSLVYAEAAVHGGVISQVLPETSAGVPDLAKRAAAATQGAAIAARHCNTPR